MKVVISGYYGFDNVGDEAIVYAIIQALRKENPSIEITVLSHQPEVTAERYQVQAVDRWNVKAVMGALRQSDGLISGGGSLLQDETGKKTIPYYAGIIQLAKWLRKPVFIYAQGMGPFHATSSRWIVKQALKRTTLTVRDEASRDLLREVGLKQPITIVPDPVLGIDPPSKGSNWLAEQQIEQPIIAVSVRNWPTTEPYQEKMAEALSAIAQSGYTIVFVPMHSAEDGQASQEVANLMTVESVIAPTDASIHEKIAIIDAAQLLVGIRLHALIFAAVVHTPFIALSYDPKIDAFAQICEQPIAGRINEPSFQADALLERMQEKLAHHSQEQQQLQQVIEPLTQAAQQTAQAAVRAFNKK